MSREMCIGGEWFEVIRPRKHKPMYAVPGPHDYLDITEAYQRPSLTKQEIWDYWCDFLGDEHYLFGMPFISSRNCMCFTVTCNVFDWHDLDEYQEPKWCGVAVITRDHNRLYLA